MYTCVFVHREIPIASAIMPQVVDRIMAFCNKYDTDTKPDEVKEQVWRLFGCGDMRLGLWAVVKDNKTVVAHLFAQPEPVNVENGPWQYVLIRQAESDKGEDTRAETRVIMDSVEKWTRRLGVQRLVMLTHRRDDVMSRRWGFKYFKALMEKHI